MSDLSLPLDAQELIPHRPPMRLVERLLEVDGNNGVVEARIDPAALLIAADGMLEDLALVEIMAQSYAALKGYIDRRDQLPVRQGFLVGIKKIVCHGSVQANDLLQVHIRTIAELEDFAVAEGKIRRGDEVIAEGDVKVWIN